LTKTSYQSPKFGNKLGHQIFHRTLRWFGPSPAYVLLAFVVSFYVFLRKRPRQLASFYLKRRFPEDTFLRRLFRTYNYIFHFGMVLIDQAAMGILGRKAFKIDFPGREELLNLSKEKKGIVLITSHFGNWQTAMAAVEDLAVPVNFLIRLEEHMEGRYFFDLAGIRNKVKMIDPAGFAGGLVDAIKVLEEGECVSIMGDRAWGSRTQYSDFLGKQAAFPISPYYLASASGADPVVLLTVRTGKLSFKIYYFYLKDEDTEWKNLSTKETINRLLPKYVRILEDLTEKYPFMWFNIFNFWNKSKNNNEKK